MSRKPGKLLRFGKVDDLFTLIRTTGRAGAVGELGGLALRTDGNLLRCQKVMRAPHVLAGFGSLLLRYCHIVSPLCGGTVKPSPLFIRIF